jgi:2,4-dichlorophenol 6-monooxygenase
VSTHDLCGRGRFVLLTAPNDRAWREAARFAAERHRVPLEVISIGGSTCDAKDADGVWAQRREIGDDGAILVRPDVHVGYRAARAPADPSAALDAALRRILGKKQERRT